MGNGTFNLTALYRALGIKNPEPSVREFVQPVINVGDFAVLTPLHRPPMQAFGGDIVGVPATFVIIQLLSLGPGGSQIVDVGASLLLPYRTDIPLVAGLTESIAGATFSNEPVQSRVFFGNDAVEPGSQLVSPHWPNTTFGEWPGSGDFIAWLPHGTVLTTWNPLLGNAINDWSITVMDIPASEAPEA